MGPSKPKLPDPVVVPPAVSQPTPKEDTKAVQEAAAEAAMRRSRGRGFRATILRNLAGENPNLKSTLGS